MKKTSDLRPYAALRMQMRRKLHWPHYKWDGNDVSKMRLRDYVQFVILLVLNGSEGLKKVNNAKR